MWIAFSLCGKTWEEAKTRVESCNTLTNYISYNREWENESKTKLNKTSFTITIQYTRISKMDSQNASYNAGQAKGQAQVYLQTFCF